MELTIKQKNNLKWLSKKFEGYEKSKSERKYISKDLIKKMDLEELYNYNCYYIENTNIMIDVKRIIVKGGNFEYKPQGYNFIKYVEGNE